MRASLKILVGISSILLASGAVQAKKSALLIPIIPYPGSTTTSVFGIADDNNTIAGSYVDSAGTTHGFTGTLDGNYTSFDFGDSGSTQARAIDASGTLITGFSNIAADHCSFAEFEKIGKKAPKAVKQGKTVLNGEAQGLNSKGTFAGDFCDTGGSGTIFGLLGLKAKYKSTVTVPFDTVYTGERAVNTAGTIAGFYVDSSTGFQVGTLIVGGTTNQITYPDDSELYTVLEGINDSGIAAGQWEDSSDIVHGFSYDSNKNKFTEIDDPNAASFTQPWGVNSSGLIAVSSDAGSYIYCPLKKKLCPKTGADARQPIEIAVNEIRGSTKALLHYGDARKGAWHAVPAALKLPHGAALQ